jgi:hypothetical protein
VIRIGDIQLPVQEEDFDGVKDFDEELVVKLLIGWSFTGWKRVLGSCCSIVFGCTVCDSA